MPVARLVGEHRESTRKVDGNGVCSCLLLFAETCTNTLVESAMSSDRSEPILNRSLLLLALGGLLAACWSSVSRVHHHRLHSRSVAMPRPEQSWEDEGGRPLPEDVLVPDSPSPAVPAATKS
jgi:hypothetical protein